MICIAGLIGAVAWLLRKYLDMRNKLKYEMQDVRNIAHLPFDNEMPDDHSSNKQYSSILKDKPSSLQEIEMK